MFDISIWIILTIIFSSIVLGLIALLEKPSDKTNRTFFLMTLFVAIWQSSNFLENGGVSLSLAKIFLRIDFASAIFVSYCWFLFVLNFSQAQRVNIKPIFRILLFSVVLLLSLLSFTDLVVSSTGFNRGVINFDAGYLWFLYALGVIGFFIAGYIIIILNLIKSQGLAKIQTFCIFLGFSISSVIILVINLFLTNYLTINQARVGLYGTIIFVFCCFYAIIKQRLFNVKIIAAELLIFALWIVLSLNAFLSFGSRIFLFNAIILISVLIIGFFLIKGVTREVEQRKYFAIIAQENQDIGRKLAVTAEKLKELNKTLEKRIFERTRELVGAKAKDEALLESIGEGVAAVDIHGKILFVNHAFEELLGWKQNEVVGKSMVDVIPREDEAGSQISFKERILSQILVGKKVTTIDNTALPLFYFVRKNKTRFPVSAVVTPVIIDNKISGAVEIFRDITKEKEIEKLRMDFLALASHQLRTPLSGTKWLIETMQEGLTGKIEKKGKEYLNNIYQMNERMIQLVSEMLGVLRLESEAGPVKKEVVSIPSIYKDISISMLAAAKSRKIILHSTLKNNKTAKIETNQEILKSILECFISNAINYSEPGQKVNLSAKEEAAAVVFRVQDSGIGIPEKEQRKIFERFYRASNAKDFKPAGSGLGLNIAKVLAEKIGAEISFKSKENKGSIFYLRIPKGRAGM